MKWVTTDQGFSEVFTPAGMPRPHYGPLVDSIESFTRTHDWTSAVAEDAVAQQQQQQQQSG